MSDNYHMLSTVDNPFNPHTHFDEWNAYDQRQGHHTLSFLARLVRSSKELSEQDQNDDQERAILEVVEQDVTGIYIRIPSNGPFLELIDRNTGDN